MAIIRPDWSRQTDDWGFYRFSAPFTTQSDIVMFVSSITMLSAAIHPTAAATSFIEYTLSAPALVDAGTALWVKWPAGDVTVSSADALLSCVTAIRGRSAGSATLEIVAT